MKLQKEGEGSLNLDTEGGYKKALPIDTYCKLITILDTHDKKSLTTRGRGGKMSTLRITSKYHILKERVKTLLFSLTFCL